MKLLYITSLLIFFAFSFGFSQRSYEILGDRNYEKIEFEKLNNLIILDLQVNGSSVSFILDSGSNNNILFALPSDESLIVKNTRPIKLRGLGLGEDFDTIYSEGNTVQIGNIKSQNESFYVLLTSNLDISNKVGKSIHGILGHSFFKDFIIDINYRKEHLKVYNPEFRDELKFSKWEIFDLQIENKKSYIDVSIEEEKNARLLIDTGNSDAIWLFEKSNPKLRNANPYFMDFLGAGLNGPINGKRSFLNSLGLGKFNIKKPNVSYPDSIYVSDLIKNSSRNGSIGGGLLSRFLVRFDFPNSKISFKRNGSFKAPFYYNNAGIEVAMDGNRFSRQKVPFQNPENKSDETHSNISFVFDYSYKFVLVPVFKIISVRKNSIAEKIGIKEEDIILSVNKNGKIKSLEELTGYFYNKPGSRIELKIERNGLEITKVFDLYNPLESIP